MGGGGASSKKAVGMHDGCNCNKMCEPEMLGFVVAVFLWYDGIAPTRGKERDECEFLLFDYPLKICVSATQMVKFFIKSMNITGNGPS